jgi:hypothetical protein
MATSAWPRDWHCSGFLLLVADLLGWRIVRPLLDRERLIAGTRS